jgi:hypothetical protein
MAAPTPHSPPPRITSPLSPKERGTGIGVLVSWLLIFYYFLSLVSLFFTLKIIIYSKKNIYYPTNLEAPSFREDWNKLSSISTLA